MNVEACPQHLEIGLCIDAHEALLAEGIRSRVVSMPFWASSNIRHRRNIRTACCHPV
jgi:transketolase